MEKKTLITKLQNDPRIKLLISRPVLIGLTVLVLAWLVTSNESAKINPEPEELFLPELSKELDSVTDINITANGKETHITKKYDNWVLHNGSGYPINIGLLRTMVHGLANLKIIEAKTNNPKDHKIFGLEGNGEGDIATTRLVLGVAPEKRIVADVLVGSLRRGAHGFDESAVYVRKYGDNQVWLVAGDLEIISGEDRWLDKEILNISHDQVQSVVIDYTGKNRVEITREKSKDGGPGVLNLANLPKGKTIKDLSKLYQIAAALQNLKFEAVKPIKEIDFPKKRRLDVTYQTTTGQTIALKLITKNKKKWLNVSITAGPSASEEVQAQTKALNQKLAAWAYQIPEFKAKVLTTKLKDLVK